ncbi:MAG: tetrahydrofolate dehydrogenase/cyclohydrolase catalytic domain-containing protein [Planctomycetaceae bacterium]
MTATIIDGKQIAQQIRDTLKDEVARFTQETRIEPHLCAVLTGDDPASAVYVRNKQRACDQVGIRSTLHRMPADTKQTALLELVEHMNQDPAVHGILVQLPLPSQIDATFVLDAICPQKDVDAFHPENVGLLVQGRPRFVPCTPQAIQFLLEDCGASIAGAHVVVLGRSEIVGKPVAALLSQKGPGGDATVTLCHSRTRDLPAVVRSADIVVAALGIPRFVTGPMVKPGAIVIDVGINRTDEGLVGDVDFDQVAPHAAAITPVPGGVGPMTIAMLLRNTLAAAHQAAQV